MSSIKDWIRSPRFEGDEQKTYQARILNVALNTSAALSLVLLGARFLDHPEFRGLAILSGAAFVTFLVLRWPLQHGWTRFVTYSWVVSVTVAITAALIMLGTTRAPLASGYILTIILAGIVRGRRGLITTLVLNCVVILLLVYAESTGRLVPVNMHVNAIQGITFISLFIVSGVIVDLAFQRMTSALKNAQFEIEDRRRAEDELRESEARFRELADAGFESIAITRGGRIQDVNAQFTELFDTPRALLLGRPILEFVAPRHRDLVQSHIQAGDEHPYEHDMLRTDGTSFPVEVRSRTATSRGERVRITAIRDITKRRETEQELFRSQQMLRLVFDTIPQRVFWKDRNSVYLGCNVAFARDAGVDDPSKVVGTTDYDLSWKANADLYRADDLQVITSGQPKLGYEEPQHRGGGSPAWLRTSKVPLRDIEGNVFGVLGTYEDITERKHAEEQLRASLEEKTVLLKEIHHRVKNNLQVISSLLSLQANVVDNQLVTDVFRDSQHRIRSMALVHENLYQSGNLARITLGDYVRSLLAHLLHSYGSERIGSEILAEPVSLSVNQAIPVGLIVNELISNAFKHAFPGGKTGTVRIQISDETGSRTKIVVSDTGVGLPEGFRMDDTRTLGLQLISTLTQQVGGQLEFSSSAGGTTFTVTFPRE